MTALERAHAYAAIFIRVGSRWPGFVPVDATMEGDTVYLQGVRMRPAGDGWALAENDRTWYVRPTKAVAS